MKNTLKKSEILKGRSAFQDIFKNGETLRKRNIKIFFLISSPLGDDPVSIGFTVSKKMRKKIYRNRAKRILKEFYRLNKKDLYIELLKNNKCIKVIVLCTNNDEEAKKISYGYLFGDLKSLFDELILTIKSDV